MLVWRRQVVVVHLRCARTVFYGTYVLTFFLRYFHHAMAPRRRSMLFLSYVCRQPLVNQFLVLGRKGWLPKHMVEELANKAKEFRRVGYNHKRRGKDQYDKKAANRELREVLPVLSVPHGTRLDCLFGSIPKSFSTFPCPTGVN